MAGEDAVRLATAELPETRSEAAIPLRSRGKVIGGSSSVNVMAYVRGNRGDFDRWAAHGLSGWSYADVLPYFRRSETWEGGADAYRGGDGPLKVRRSRYDDPLLGSFIAAGGQTGSREGL